MLPSLALPALALSLALAASAQSPNLQPGRLLPGSPTVGPAAEVQQGAACAAGSGSSLLVFEDRRAGDSDLFGLRLDANGIPLDPLPFPVTKDPGNQTAPKVVWSGQAWLVVYSNQVDPGSGYFAYQVAALRVSPQGLVLDAAPIVVSIDGTGGGFAAASDGAGWAVAYTGYSAGNGGIRARRITAAGSVLDPGGVLVVPETYYILSPVGASFAGAAYLFTWGDNGLRGRRFTPALLPIDANPVLVHEKVAALAGNGTNHFLAWPFQNAQYQGEILGARLGADLRLLDPTPLPISGARPNDNAQDPLVVWDGTQWIVAWLHLGTTAQRAARVSAGGSLLDPGGVAIPENSPNYLYGPALGALPAGGALLAWHDGRNGASDVFGTPFRGNGSAGTERTYSVGSETLQEPRVAAGPQQYLLTFRALSAPGSRILAQRVDAYGAALDLEPIQVASATHANLNAGGAAWNGSCYLVVWSESGQIQARRMRADGTFLDPAPIAVLLGGGADVAALGGDFLVTGIRAPSYPQYVFSYGARVRGTDGAVLDPTPLGLGNSYATRARVVALGQRWLVVTERHWTHNSHQSDLETDFVDASGIVTPGPNPATVNIQDWGSSDVASAGDHALVVCQSGSNWTNTEVFARVILADGTLASSLLNLTAADSGGQSRAAVAWTGREYVVCYQSLQNNAWFYDYEPDVYGVRVSATGTLLDARGFAVWQGEDYERTPDVTGLGSGRALFAAAAYVDGPYAAFRIATRELRPAGVQSYGTGTPGCEGAQRLHASGPPELGAGGFALYCDRAPRSATGVALLGSTGDLAGTFYPALGVRLHVALSGGALLTLPWRSDGAGLGTLPLPLPGDPGLRGARLHAQGVWPWGTTCPLLPLGLSASEGLELVLQ
ncbi:MAG: hypothetical protein IT458_04980 [Planctomycetes bacterium]|nr:hypothetical protein [Planctomycetota bacterium]